jgi:hypothetical protein
MEMQQPANVYNYLSYHLRVLVGELDAAAMKKGPVATGHRSFSFALPEP